MIHQYFIIYHIARFYLQYKKKRSIQKVYPKLYFTREIQYYI